MGISGEPTQLLNLAQVHEQKIPVIKRFSGGGTVIVDENTFFITFLIAKCDLDVAPFPEPILRWSANLYTSAWDISGFQLKENDYCIGDKKCGGNAQYIRKDRWLHHTSFLWDFCANNMNALLLPPKRPCYRKDRAHTDFLCKLKWYGCNPMNRIAQLRMELAKLFDIENCEINSMECISHRQATRTVDLR